MCSHNNLVERMAIVEQWLKTHIYITKQILEGKKMEFFTWNTLVTYTGATLITTLVTQLFKGVGFIDKLPTRVFSYIVALVVMLLAHIFMGSMTWANAGLCVVNAVVVSLAANGAFDMTLQKTR